MPTSFNARLKKSVIGKSPMRNPEVAKEANYNVWGDDDLLADASESGLETSPEIVAMAVDAGSLATPAPLRLLVANLGVSERLDKWLASRLTTYSRARLQQWISAGAVSVNGLVASVRQPVWQDDVVEVRPQASAEEVAFQAEPMKLEILHEDDSIIVLNKPAGLVVHPAAGNWSGTLLNGLLHHAPQLAGVPRAGIVHRLDKDTSGLMVVAKSLHAQTHLVRQLQARSVKREYLAMVYGAPPDAGMVDAGIGRHLHDRLRMAAFDAQGMINVPTKKAAIKTIAGTGVNVESSSTAKPALTRFRVLQRAQIESAMAQRNVTNGVPCALINCALETGRTHQIRVHMQAIGFPLIGDPLYGRKPDALAEYFKRQALHAWQLGLLHPQSEAPMMWQVAPPDDFLQLMQHLGFDCDALPGKPVQ